VLSGGETAVHVARALGARGLLIEDELEPGVPVSRLLGPRAYRVVTKAGGFGGPATLVRAVEALAGPLRARAGAA
ncbi:MAG TPA: nucleotide-binding domain containing protein, partial [Solirubrobacteraceae bacterium]|nr:nucleotide-binding domain containing protein [Solirubrobacteraceae bacterium]